MDATNGANDDAVNDTIDDAINDDKFLETLAGLKFDDSSHSTERDAAVIKCLKNMSAGSVMPMRAKCAIFVNKALQHSKGPNTQQQAEEFGRLLPTVSLRSGEGEASLGPADIDFHRSVISTVGLLHVYHVNVLMRCLKPTVGTYLVSCIGSKHIDIALAACEYLATIGNIGVPEKFTERWVAVFRPQLDWLVESLLRCMVYHPQIAEHIEKYGSQATNSSGCSGGVLSYMLPDDIEKFLNTRNYAALAFENVCRIFPDEVVSVFQPHLERWIDSRNWLETEAIMLALSAFTEAVGAPTEMRAVYPTLIPKILDLYTDVQPLVRSIACFTLPHFLGHDMKGVRDPLPKVIKFTLAQLNDICPEVKSIAVRSLAKILAYVPKDISAHIARIAESLIKVDRNMTGESRCTYYECIAHLFGRAFDQLDDKDMERLIAPLIESWSGFDARSLQSSGMPEEVGMVTVCEALAVVATYSKHHFAPYSPQIFDKVSPLLEGINAEVGRGDAMLDNAAIGANLTALLAMLNAVIDGQGSTLESNVTESHLVKRLYEILNCPHADQVHQGAFALLGNISRYCPGPHEPNLGNFIDIIFAKIESPSDDVRNGALWALAFVSHDPTVDVEKLFSIVDRLIVLVKMTDDHSGCIINAALALTAMCAQHPKQTLGVIVRTDVFLHLCGLLQTRFPRDLEKIEIFRNLCSVLVTVVPKVSAELWVPFLVAVALLPPTDDDSFHQALKGVVREVRTTLGNIEWPKAMHEVGPHLAFTLRKRYKLY